MAQTKDVEHIIIQLPIGIFVTERVWTPFQKFSQRKQTETSFQDLFFLALV
jgi:hypothetical protein